jgi:hypothetical protein
LSSDLKALESSENERHWGNPMFYLTF